MRLRGCISCLLPGRKPPTKTLTSNVSGDNDNPAPIPVSLALFSILFLFDDHRSIEFPIESEREHRNEAEIFSRTRKIRDKENSPRKKNGEMGEETRKGGRGRRGAGGSSNSEENGLVYLKILGRAARCLGRRGLDETLSIFAPARSPPPPAIASPRASSRPFEPLCQSLRQPPRGSSSRDSSSRPRTSVPGKRRETVPPDRGGRW